MALQKGRRISWCLTEEGKTVADRLWKAEIDFQRRFCSPKYYKR